MHQRFPRGFPARYASDMDTLRRLLIATQFGLAVGYALYVLSAERPTHSDFHSFYTGWSIVRDGQGGRLYDLDLQGAYQAKAFGLETSDSRFGLLPFINPPHAALILTPFAYFSPNAAASIYLAFNCLCAAWVLYRLWQLAAGWSMTEQILLLTTTLATEVFWYNLGTGTITLLIFVCLIEYYLAMRGRREGWAAFWLIAGTLKPQLILLPALIPLAQHRWRLVGTAVTLGLLVGLGVSLSFGFHIWVDYLQLLRQVGSHGEVFGADPMLMNNLRMILYGTVPPAAVAPLAYLGLLVGIVGICWLWRSARDFGLRFALTVLLGLFLAPHLNYQDTLFAILPAALAYDFARRERGGLILAFQVLMLIATFLPMALIFTGYTQTLGRIWPLPLIVGLAAMSTGALLQRKHERPSETLSQASSLDRYSL
jgi:hypothetical protein